MAVGVRGQGDGDAGTVVDAAGGYQLAGAGAHLAALGLDQLELGIEDEEIARAAEVLPEPPAATADRARASGPRPAGQCAGLEVLRSPAAVSPVPHLRPRWHRARPLDARRLGRQGDGAAGAAGRCDQRHVLAGQALFGDDTPVKLLAPGTGKTATGRAWTYVRDERPWNGEAPPAAWYRFSADRKAAHPKSHLAGFAGWMHSDGYAGFGALARAGPIREVACLAHVWRKFFDVHAAQGSAIAAEALERIAALYAIEKEARGLSPENRAAIRQARAAPCLDELERWLHSQLPRISAKTPLAAAIRHALTRLKRLRPYLEHGFLEIDNNPAERAMRPIALGRKNYLFMGSANGGRAAAIAYTLIETARLNDVDPQAWLAQVLERIPDYKINRVDELLPWNCSTTAKPGPISWPTRGGQAKRLPALSNTGLSSAVHNPSLTPRGVIRARAIRDAGTDSKVNRRRERPLRNATSQPRTSRRFASRA